MLRNLPPVTKNFLLINILVYVISVVMVSSNSGFYIEFASHYINSVHFEPYTIVTHMFMHSMTDIFHIFFNMFLLVMFGAHLERIWGAKRFFIFYISCGIGAYLLFNVIGIIQINETQNALGAIGNDISELRAIIAEGNLTTSLGIDRYAIDYQEVQKTIDSGEIIITSKESAQDLFDLIMLNKSSILGASGAIFGLLAGFAILFPNTEMMLIFLPIPIKAKYLIGAYLLYEVYNSIYNSGDNIAHLAHVGGAIVGIILILIWRKKSKTFY